MKWPAQTAKAFLILCIARIDAQMRERLRRCRRVGMPEARYVRDFKAYAALSNRRQRIAVTLAMMGYDARKAR
jgi:hypothetical protein